MAQVNEQEIRQVAEKLFSDMDSNQNGMLEESEVREFTR